MKAQPTFFLALCLSLLIHAACLIPILHLDGTPERHGGKLSQRYQEQRTLRLTLRHTALRPSKPSPVASKWISATIDPLPTPATSMEAKVGYEEVTNQANIEGARRYFAPTELSRKPQLYEAFEIEPELLFTDAPGEGKLILKLFLSEEGRIDRIEADSSNLPKELEERLIQNFRRIKYQPGEKDGQPVSSWVRIEIQLLPPETLPNALP